MPEELLLLGHVLSSRKLCRTRDSDLVYIDYTIAHKGEGLKKC